MKSRHRSSGTRRIASTPSLSSRQYPSGPCTPPGSRQPTPMTATGSLCDVTTGTGREATSSVSPHSRATSASPVGVSHTSVAGSSRPRAYESSPASATASREDMPRSASGRSIGTSWGAMSFQAATRSVISRRSAASPTAVIPRPSTT